MSLTDSSESHTTVQEDLSTDSSDAESSNLTRLARALGIRPAATLPPSPTPAASGSAVVTSESRMSTETPRFVYRQADLPLFDIETDRNDAFFAWKVKWDDYCDLSYLSLEPQSRQVRVLRRCMSSPTLTVLRNLGIPEDPTQTTTKQIIQKLQEYVAKNINVNIEWNNLMSRFQAPNETIDDYVLALRQIVQGCDTCRDDACADRAVRVQLVRGVRDSEVTRELLKQTGLTLKTAVDVARSIESAKSDSGAIHRNAGQGPEVHQMSSFKRNKKFAKQGEMESRSTGFGGNRPRGDERGHDRRGDEQRHDDRRSEDHRPEDRRGNVRRRNRCQTCGRGEHPEGRQCPAINERCDFCRRVGHFKRACPDRQRQIAAIDSRVPDDRANVEWPFQGALQVAPPLHGRAPVSQEDELFQNFAVDPHFYHVWMPSLSAIETAPKAWIRAAPDPNSTPHDVLVLPDTGADITAVDRDFLTSCGIRGPINPPTIRAAGAANGSMMRPIGTVRVCWRHEDKFVLDDVHVFNEITKPLLGWRISEALGLVTYNFRKVFAENTGPNQASGGVTPKNLKLDASSFMGHNMVKIEEKVAPTSSEIECMRLALISEFPEVFSDRIKCMEGEQFVINLTDNPVPFRVTAPRAVPLAYKDALQRELKTLREQDIIEPVTYPTEWCSPIVVEPKSDGVRLCVDFTKLNKFVRREYYTVEPPAKQVAAIAESHAKFFSSLDAVKGYHQCPLQESSRDLTTFITPFGRFRYKRAPFGISSISEHYNRRMDESLTLCTQRTRRVVDDLAVFDATFKAHVEHVRQILRQCQQKGITLSKKKFVFAQASLKFAGFIINNDGYTIDPAITSAIAEFPVPKNVTDVRAFLGLVNQLSGMRPDISQLLAPIRPLLSPKNTFLWTQEMQQAFEAARSALCKQPLVAYFDLSKLTRLLTDASRQGLGFVLQQKDNEGHWRTVQAGSRALLDCETRYAVIELEMLAVCFAMRKTITFVTGIEVQVLTDHRPLVSIINDRRMDEIENPRLRRMRQFLAQFQVVAKHIQGKTNSAADALSRYPSSPPPLETLLTKNLVRNVVIQEVSATSNIANYYDELEAALVAAANSCSQYQSLKALLLDAGFPEHKNQLPSDLRAFWPMKEHIALHKSCTSHDLLIFCGRRALVPKSMRKRVLETLHAGHQGVRRMQQLARHFVYWPAIDSDIEVQATSCPACTNFAPAERKPLLRQPDLPTRPFQDISMDLFQIGSRHFLAIVDAFSLWPELVMFSSAPTSAAVTKVCMETWARFGAPNVCRTDNGPQFKATTFTNFLLATFTKHVRSAPYYPQSNGRAEAAVKVLKNIVKKASYNSGSVYDTNAVTKAIWVYRNTPTNDGLSPAEKMFGRPVRTPLVMSERSQVPVTGDQVDRAFVKRQEEQRAIADRYNRDAHALGAPKMNDLVRIRNQVTGEYDLQGRVVKMENDNRRLKIRLHNGVTVDRDRRHIRLCRPAIADRTSTCGNAVVSPGVQRDIEPNVRSENQRATTCAPVRRSTRQSKKPDRFADSAYSGF